MSALVIGVTLWVLPAVPPASPPVASMRPAAWVLVGPGVTHERALVLPARVTAGKHRRRVRLKGGCLLRLAKATRIRIDAPARGTRCPAITLDSGRMGVVAARRAQPAFHLTIAQQTYHVHHGVGLAVARRTVRGLCVQRGAATVTQVPPTVAKIGAGRCHWLHGADARESAFRPTPVTRRLLRSGYRFVTPKTPLDVDLAGEIARLRSRALAGQGGTQNVEGGGQSMCLDTGGEGSAADLGGVGGVDIVKPPPPTRLRLRIQLQRSGR